MQFQIRWLLARWFFYGDSSVAHLGKYPSPYPQANNKQHKQKKTFSAFALFVPREYCESNYSVVFKGPISWMGKCIKFHLAVIQSLLMLSPEIMAPKNERGAFRPKLLLFYHNPSKRV